MNSANRFKMSYKKLRTMSAEQLCKFYNRVLSQPYYCISGGTFCVNNAACDKCCYHGRKEVECFDCGGKDGCRHSMNRVTCWKCRKESQSNKRDQTRDSETLVRQRMSVKRLLNDDNQTLGNVRAARKLMCLRTEHH